MKKVYAILLAVVCSALFTVSVFAGVLDGDVNGDEKINAADALMVLKHAAYIEKIDGKDIGCADVNKDMTINANDALEILKFAAGIINIFEEVEEGLIYHNGNFKIISDEINVSDEIVEFIGTMEEYEEILGEYHEYLPAGTYGEDFFVENTLLCVKVHLPASGYLDVTLEKLINTDKNIQIYVNCLAPESLSDVESNWSVFIPMNGKNWDEYSYEVVYEEYFNSKDCNETDITYGEAQFLSLGCENHNDTQSPRVRVFTTYKEYEKYIDPIKNKYMEGEFDKELVLYDETFFDINSLIVVDYTNTDYSTEVCFKNIEYSDIEKVYKINIEHYDNMIALPMLRPVEIIIPVEKKDISAEDFRVEIIGIYDIYAYEIQGGNVKQIEAYGIMDYPMVLKNYEEYTEYIELFKAANPDYELKVYTKEYFEYYKPEIIVGGFWTNSGQTDIEYVNTVRKNGKYIINFNGRCPSTHTCDTYYYHYMLETSYIDIPEENIEVNVDVKYY